MSRNVEIRVIADDPLAEKMTRDLIREALTAAGYEFDEPPHHLYLVRDAS